MGLFPLKGRTGFLGHSRTTLAELQALGRTATQAATATLERLTQTPVRIESARVSLVPRDQVATHLGGYADAEIAARLPLGSSNPGTLATMFSKKDALELVALLLGRPAGAIKRLGELESSAVAEMTNIALNGAINRIAEEGGVRFATGVPTVENRLQDVAAFFGFDADATTDHAVIVDSRFHETTRDIHGALVFVFGVAGAAPE